MNEQLLETRQINNRINLYLLNAIKEEWLVDLPVSQGRNVGEQFGHIHSVRLMWIKSSVPALLKGLDKIDKETGVKKNRLQKNMEASSELILNLLEEVLIVGKVKGFNPHPGAFLGYLLAHEAHHRGQIMVTLKENKHLKDKKRGLCTLAVGVPVK